MFCYLINESDAVGDDGTLGDVIVIFDVMNMNACFLCEHFAMSLVGGISSIRWYELASSIVVGVGSIMVVDANDQARSRTGSQIQSFMVFMALSLITILVQIPHEYQPGT